MDLNSADFAIGGVAPRNATAPANAEALRDAVRALAPGERFAPWGGGVSLPHESAPTRLDLVLSLRALDHVVRWEPDDFTLTAEAGVTVAALRAALAARGQELPLEAAHAERATLGGVLAANASGPRRLRFGAPRDRLLGARFVTGDGVLARTGGRVVKNVAGHAVHRLLVGSEGGLGVFVEASLKLLPLPPARLAQVHAFDAAAIADPAPWRGFVRREPAVLTVLGRTTAAEALGAAAPDAPFAVVSGFEEDPTWVADCAAFTRRALGAEASSREADDVPPLWQSLTDLEERPGARLTCTSAHRTPDALAPLLARGVSDTLVFHAACGRLHLWPRPEDVPALASLLAAAGFTPIARRGLAWPERADSPATRALRQRLSDALDPRRACALGDSWRAR